MAYIAKKVCSFGGVEFLIGDTIPEELVNPDRVAELKKIGVLDEFQFEEPQEGIVKFTINIHVEEGELPLELTNDGLQKCFDVLQENAEEAKAVIHGIENENVLILLDVVESRKGVKAAIKERVSELFPQEEETGQ